MEESLQLGDVVTLKDNEDYLLIQLNFIEYALLRLSDYTIDYGEIYTSIEDIIKKNIITSKKKSKLCYK